MKQQPLLQKIVYAVAAHPMRVPAAPILIRTTDAPADVVVRSTPPIKLTKERMQLMVPASQPRHLAISPVDAPEIVAPSAVYST